MKCIVPSQNVKIVARGIHSLAKIGDELFIEPTENGLVFCVLSLAQSAICYFRMSRSFFSSYSYTTEDSISKCRIAMKSCLGVFKNPHCMDKQVESCEIRLKPNGSSVTFHIKYSNSSVKKYFIPTLENEALEASYEKEAANRFVFPVKILSSSMKNFRATEDEVTILVSQDRMIIKNCSLMKKDAHCMRTELTFHRSEFDCYNVNSPCAVTLCLKEMRSVIMFAEWSNLPVVMQFNKPGDPIIFLVANHHIFEATYVIQTLRKPSMESEISILTASITKTKDTSRENRAPSTVDVSTSRSVGRRTVDALGPQESLSSKSLRQVGEQNRGTSNCTEVEAGPSCSVMIPEAGPSCSVMIPEAGPSCSVVIPESEPVEDPEVHLPSTQPMEGESGLGALPDEPMDVDNAPNRSLPATQPMEDDVPEQMVILEPEHILPSTQPLETNSLPEKSSPSNDGAENIKRLVKIVFQRCFRQKYILDFHPGHSVTLAYDSDKE